jgi:hypothetical protein
VAPDVKALRRLDRKLDRQRRANNLANYDERGRVKQFKQRWKVPKRQRQVLARRHELHRMLTATRKRSQEQLALGNAFRPRAALLSGVAANLREVGPALCTVDVCRTAVSPGCECWGAHGADERQAQGSLKQAPVASTARKPLSQRWPVCTQCGACAQRDLFSAYLARFVDPETSPHWCGSGT